MAEQFPQKEGGQVISLQERKDRKVAQHRELMEGRLSRLEPGRKYRFSRSLLGQFILKENLGRSGDSSEFALAKTRFFAGQFVGIRQEEDHKVAVFSGSVDLHGQSQAGLFSLPLENIPPEIDFQAE